MNTRKLKLGWEKPAITLNPPLSKRLLKLSKRSTSKWTDYSEYKDIEIRWDFTPETRACHKTSISKDGIKAIINKYVSKFQIINYVNNPDKYPIKWNSYEAYNMEDALLVYRLNG